MLGGRGHRGRSRGQALVEFALVTPVFFLVFFSVIEFALIVASIGSYNFAARDAARLGSILGRQTTTSSTDGQMVGDIRSRVQGLVMAQVQEIDIYRAASDGQCLDAATGTANEVSVDSSSCVKNQYTVTGAVMSGTSVQWTTDQRDDSLESADYIGVRVIYRYTYLTGFIAAFGSSFNLSATSVQRIEPQEFTGLHGPPPAEAAGSGGARWQAAWTERVVGRL